MKVLRKSNLPQFPETDILPSGNKLLRIPMSDFGRLLGKIIRPIGDSQRRTAFYEVRNRNGKTVGAFSIEQQKYHIEVSLEFGFNEEILDWIRRYARNRQFHDIEFYPDDEDTQSECRKLKLEERDEWEFYCRSFSEKPKRKVSERLKDGALLSYGLIMTKGMRNADTLEALKKTIIEK